MLEIYPGIRDDKTNKHNFNIPLFWSGKLFSDIMLQTYESSGLDKGYYQTVSGGDKCL